MALAAKLMNLQILPELTSTVSPGIGQSDPQFPQFPSLPICPPDSSTFVEHHGLPSGAFFNVQVL